MAWLNSIRLKSADPNVRSKALENLAGSSRSRDTELIVASLTDESPQVRCAAVRALGKSDSAESQRSLVGALQDKSFEVREAAARALGRAGNLQCAGALGQCLRDADPAVRAAAASSLRTMGWRPCTREESAWFEIALGNTPSASISTEFISQTHTWENQDTTFHRRVAAENLRARNDETRVNALIHGLRSPDLLKRISCIHDLAQTQDNRASGEILRLFRDPEPEVRLAAAQALAGREDAQPAHFLGLLEDDSPEVRLQAVQFLRRIPHQHIAEVLVPLLSDSTVAIRRATAEAMGAMGNPGAIEDLVISLADEDKQVRELAEEALNQIDPGWINSDSALNARVSLESALKARKAAERWVGEQVLAMLNARFTVPIDDTEQAQTA